MALTRPRIQQFNTSVSSISDPITVLKAGTAQANVDVGFLINRANGLVSNVSLYWNEAGNTFVTAFTADSGSSFSNIAATSYSNFTTGNIYANAIVVDSIDLVSTLSQAQTDIITLQGQVYTNSNVDAYLSSSGSGNVTISSGAFTLTEVGPGATTVGSATAIPVITTDAYGRIVALTSASVSSTLNTAGSTGTGSVALTNQSLTFAGELGVTANASGQTITISTPQDLRTTANPTFNSATFATDITVFGNVNATYLNTIGAEQLTVDSSLVYLQSSGVYPYNYDIGMFGHFKGGPANVYGHTGGVRSYENGWWGFFSNVKTEPTTVIDWNNAGIVWDAVKVGDSIVSNTTAATSTTTGALRVSGGAGIAGTIHAGGIVAAGVDLVANAATQADAIAGANAAIITANTALKSYVDDNDSVITTAWTANAATQASAIAGANAAIIAANTALKGYVDAQDSAITSAWTANAATQASAIAGANAAIVTANTALKSYVDDQDAAITSAWTANAATQASAIAGANAAIVTANTSLKGYVDDQITTLVGGAPAVLDTLYEIANSLGNNASLSATLLNSIGAANAAIVTANTALKGYVDTSNSSMKSYVDAQDSAITSAWVANAATQQGQITTLQSQVYSDSNVAAYLPTYTGNLTAGSITTTGTSGNITGVNYITANYFVGNGSQLTGLPPGYTDSNVAAYLPTYTGNISAGNVNVSANVYATGNIYSAGSRILTAADLATVTYTADYITNDPTSVTGLSTVAGTTNTYGTYNFGDVSDILVYGDYDTNANTGFYSVNDAAGSPGHVEYIGFSNVAGFNRLNYNINYTANSGHTINFELYNYEYMHWDTFATTTGSGSWQTFTLGVIDDSPYIGTGANLGNVTTRINHVSSGNVQHRTWIDYVALEQSITGGQGPRGPTGSTGATGAQGPAWAGGYVANVTTFGSNLVANSATASSSTTTGALVVIGGAGISGSIYSGGIVASGIDLVANAAAIQSQLTGANAAIVTANTALKSYVDAQDSAITSAWSSAVSGANASIVTANTALKSYVDAQDSAITSAWSSAVSGANAAIVTANTSLKGYVDAQITSLVGGAPAVLDTLYEIANSLGNNASLSTTLLNSLAGANAAITTLQSQVYSNVNTAAYLNGAITVGNVSTTNGVFWANGAPYSAGGGKYTVDTTAPTSPATGDKWYNSTTDVLYEYQDVGTGSYWIDISGVILVSNTGTVSVSAGDSISPFLLMGA